MADLLARLGLTAPGMGAPEISLLDEEATAGDLLLAALTGHGDGDRPWVSGVLSSLLGSDTDPLGVVLTRLFELGHLELRPEGTAGPAWWLRPSRWIPDRTKGVRTVVFAAGARDHAFWQTLKGGMRVRQPSEDIPPKIARRGEEVDDWPLELARSLPPLEDWVATRRGLDRLDVLATVHRLDERGGIEATAPGAADVWAWMDGFRMTYSVVRDGHLVPVPRGVARIYATGGLPVVRRGRRLAIPRDFQPPAEYRRVLTLCSGMVPTQVIDETERTWLKYTGVDDEILEHLQRALPLHLNHV